MDAQMKWLSSNEARKLSKVAIDKAKEQFLESYPNVDISWFTVQVDFDENQKATGEVLQRWGRFTSTCFLFRQEILEPRHERIFRFVA